MKVREFIKNLQGFSGDLNVYLENKDGGYDAVSNILIDNEGDVLIKADGIVKLSKNELISKLEECSMDVGVYVETMRVELVYDTVTDILIDENNDLLIKSDLHKTITIEAPIQHLYSIKHLMKDK